jgi:hypothetical protein
MTHMFYGGDYIKAAIEVSDCGSCECWEFKEPEKTEKKK